MQNFHLTSSPPVMVDDMKFCINTDYEHSPTLRTQTYSSEVNNCKHDNNTEPAGYVDKYINRNVCKQTSSAAQVVIAVIIMGRT